MNIQARLPSTADEFLRWNQGREGKREFVAGRVIEMMINVTETHYRLASRLTVQLATQLDENEFIVGSADFGVKTRDGVRFPDVMVHRPSIGSSLATSEPLLIAEIASPSSMADDFGRKAHDYLALASLQHYIVLTQSDAALWLWTREGAGWSDGQLFQDVEEPVHLVGLQVTLDLQRLFMGIDGIRRQDPSA